MKVQTEGGIALYAESTGEGPPVVFVHELAGSCRSFDLQVAAMKDRFRCIAFNARGYPPSDVPPSVESYSQDIAAGNIAAVLDGFGLEDAHIIGISMGAASTLQFAIRNPGRARSITLTSIGSGSDMKPGEFAASMETLARLALKEGMRALAVHYAATPTRYRLKEKNPAEYGNFIEQLAAGSVLGITNTMRGVQQRRPPLYAHRERIAALALPAQVVLGEEDAPCIGPSRFLEEALPGARLEVIPRTGHCVNLEEPVLYNRLIIGFIDRAEAKRRGTEGGLRQ